MIQYLEANTELLQLLTAEQAWQYRIFPKSTQGATVILQVSEQDSFEQLRDELELLLGYEVVFEAVDHDLLIRSLSAYYRKKQQTSSNEALNYNDDFLESLIQQANDYKASDIHIETYEDVCRIRFRVDGKLMERYVIAKETYPVLINKVKIKANLDIAEKRLPQDGRIFFTAQGHKFDIRVSVLPTLYGEKIVLRLLSKSSTNIVLEQLGFNDKQLADYLEGIKKTHGIILISGPTGSGKTTTLYGTLKILNKENTNILTIEDPIEYTLDGINQVQLNDAIGLSYGSALRTFLRQDPDIIMLGEIRDGETAQMAIRAALTGHLVFSTIHTNSAWGTISRLIDMGVPSFLLANTLVLSVAQRLIRKLCKHCCEEADFNSTLLPQNYTAPYALTKHYKAKGCSECFFTGYAGRKALYEVLPIDAELSLLIRNNVFDVNEVLQKKQITRLRNEAFDCLAKGETSVDEVYSILVNDI